MSLLKKHLPVTIIAFFHLAGFIGFLINPDYFRSLTPLNLLLSAFLVILMSNQTKGGFYLFLLLVALGGWLLEVLGVKTGLIFGHYHYGQALGYRLLSVPLLIGIYWALLIYACNQICQFSNKYLSIGLSALLLTGLDFLIEQSAARLHLWYWRDSHAPIQNYVACFIIALIMSFFTHQHLAGKPNPVAKAYYVIQALFFTGLYLIARLS